MIKDIFYRKTKSGLLTASKETRKTPRTPIDSGCCSLHWMPAGEKCESYQEDTGGGILINSCSNCWHFNDRQLKYRRLVDVQIEKELDRELEPFEKVFNDALGILDKECDNAIAAAEKAFKETVEIDQKNKNSRKIHRATFMAAQKVYDGAIEKAAIIYDSETDKIQKEYDTEISRISKGLKLIAPNLFKPTDQIVPFNCPICKNKKNIKVLKSMFFLDEDSVDFTIDCECGVRIFTTYKRKK